MRKVVYLASAQPGLRWFFQYCSPVFPEGGDKAAKSLRGTNSLLIEQPGIGRPIGDGKLRERRVANTPFNLIYRVTEDGIEILRVRDTRSG